MVVKLGNLGDERSYETLSWRDFKKSEFFEDWKKKIISIIKESGEARILIERILKGGKYPSIAIIWTALSDEKQVIRVKLSIQKETFKEVLKALGITRLNECGSALDFVLFKNDDGKISYGIDKSQILTDACYIDKGSYYELTTAKKDNDELDFDF